MKNRTKGILMIVILFTVVVFVVGYLLDNYIPAFIFLVSVFIAFYIFKANELLNSDD